MNKFDNIYEYNLIISDSLSDKAMSKNFYVEQTFRHLQKFLQSYQTKRFAHFRHLKIAQKALNSFIFFRDLPFLYQKNNSSNKITHILYFSTNMLSSISLSSINSGFLFTFTFTSLHYSLPQHPHHLSSDFHFFFGFTTSLSSISSIMISIASLSWASVSPPFLASKFQV